MDQNHVLLQNYAVTSAREQWFRWMSRFYRSIKNCWSSKRNKDTENCGEGEILITVEVNWLPDLCSVGGRILRKSALVRRKTNGKEFVPIIQNDYFSWCLTIKYECKCRSKKTLKHSSCVNTVELFYLTYSGAEDNACSISTLYHPIIFRLWFKYELKTYL